jgi:hypothetical protein
MISVRGGMTAITTFSIPSTFRFLEWYGAALVSVDMAMRAVMGRRIGPARAGVPAPRSGT